METLEDIANEVKTCIKCPLHRTRTNAVPGSGNQQSLIMFIGEGPGKEEDRLGLPFVGQAGKILDELLASAEISRKDVFIGNVVKCRPPRNRDPEQKEIKACMPYLKKQILLIKPKIIVTLGRFAMNLFYPDLKISSAHGKLFHLRSGFPVLPLYHPAVALYNSLKRDMLFKDFSILKDIAKK